MGSERNMGEKSATEYEDMRGYGRLGRVAMLICTLRAADTRFRLTWNQSAAKIQRLEGLITRQGVIVAK